MEAQARIETDSIDLAVREVFGRILQVDAASLADETHLVDDLAVDSLDALELALKIQESLAIQLDEADFARFTTYGEVVACARESVARTAAGT